MRGTMRYRAAVAGMERGNVAVERRRESTPELTKPGYLWMKVMVGWDLESSSKARVVWVVPFPAAFMNVKSFLTSLGFFLELVLGWFFLESFFF